MSAPIPYSRVMVAPLQVFRRSRVEPGERKEAHAGRDAVDRTCRERDRVGEEDRVGVEDGGEFVVLVPAGGSVDLTTNGTTTAVPIDDGGIATGPVDQAATLTVTVGSSVTTTQLGPNVDQLPAGPPTGATS